MSKPMTWGQVKAAMEEAEIGDDEVIQLQILSKELLPSMHTDYLRGVEVKETVNHIPVDPGDRVTFHTQGR